MLGPAVESGLTRWSGRLASVPLSELPDVYPGIAGLDDLELFRQGLISQELLGFAQEPTKYVDQEGVPVAWLTQTGQLTWIAPRSDRPYERWHTGTTELVPPMTVLDQPRTLGELPHDTATVVVLASTEASRADLNLVRLARQRALEDDVHLVVLPLGSAAAQRAEKLAQVLGVLQRIGPITDLTSADLPRHEPEGPGLVIFFTGLSGSGKSTVARALTHQLMEDYGLEVSLLDGDVVRRELSQELTFSVADRNTNVRRIGWVAAEIARHGGIAIVSPIAPFDATRRRVRQMVAERGGRFLLVHIATPLEECERRDRKGLYSQARAGSIPNFTGISSPYEPPADADLRLDTTGVDVASVKNAVFDELHARGWLPDPSFTPSEGNSL